MMRLPAFRFQIAALLFILMLAGCATAPPRETAHAPVVPLPAPDLSPVAGRILCLDPGHGGPWPGTVAPSNGLRESDVNLQVTQFAAGLLRAAGATVILTRTDDAALVPGSLSQDLAARVKVAEDSHADLFVSIHHNADITAGSTKNDLEVFYKLGEEWASLDLAQCLTYELARRLDQTAEARRLIAGNYKVLRLSTIPAVLVESSYLSDARNAAFLADQAGIEVEGTAIAAGLARYFSLNPPHIATANLSEEDDSGLQYLTVTCDRGLPLEAGTIACSVNGERVAGVPQSTPQGAVWAFYHPLPNGDVTLALHGRSYAGAAFSETIQTTVNRPPGLLQVRQSPAAVPADSQAEVLLEVVVQDALGLPVADATTVQLKGNSSTVTGLTREGSVRFYVTPIKNSGPFTLQSGAISREVTLKHGGPQLHSLRVESVKSGAPVGNAVARQAARVIGVTTPEGWLAVPDGAGAITLTADGYDLAEANVDQPRAVVRMRPVSEGVLQGRRIVIDPWYGGFEPGATGPDGERASDVALDVARRAAALLESAGAEVELTRSSDVNPSDLERLLTAEAFDADIVVAVTFGGPGQRARLLDATGHRADAEEAFVGHYPGSANGERLARALAGELNIASVGPSVAFLVQQTGAPAVLLQPADVGDPTAATALRNADARRNTAQRIYAGIVRYFQPATTQ